METILLILVILILAGFGFWFIWGIRRFVDRDITILDHINELDEDDDD